jgi:hypothetical protein
MRTDIFSKSVFFNSKMILLGEQMRTYLKILCMFSLTLLVAMELHGQMAQKVPLEQPRSWLICAGGKELFCIDPAAKGTETQKLWTWNPDQADEIALEHRRWFGNLDECKSIADGQQLLITASNGGCALLERKTKKVLWYAYATNAHSIELLPRNRVAVASSLGGNQLLIFDLQTQQQKPIFKTALKSAHGLVWQDKRQVLYALGFDELQLYQLKAWDTDQPTLEQTAVLKLPDEDGHDLRPVPGRDELLLTTHNGVFVFDCEKRTFTPHPELQKQSEMKSVDIDSLSGRIVTSNWTKQLKFYQPTGEIELQQNRPYKARWIPSWK